MDMHKIGQFLQSLRREAGLTQEQLGERLGVTGKTISRWETGTYLPPVEMLLSLSEPYHVSMNGLALGERIAPEALIRRETLMTRMRLPFPPSRSMTRCSSSFRLSSGHSMLSPGIKRCLRVGDIAVGNLLYV